jgi:hypothetical protein
MGMNALSRLTRKLYRTAATLHVIKQALAPNDILLAGPYAGELGFELMEWSGYVRRLSAKYRRTIVISYAGHSCLYDRCDYYPHYQSLANSGYWYGSLAAKQINALMAPYVKTLGLTSFDWLHPTHLNRYTKRILGPQLFWEPFQSHSDQHRYDVAFHFRSLRRADLDEKNYPFEWTRDLVNRCKAHKIRACCIGHPQYAHSPNNCDDLRSSDLGQTRELLKNIRIVAGGSSAPMHLASLCGLPIVVWWKNSALDPELRDKYLRFWNPHATPVFVVSDSTFQPPPDQVFSQIIEALRAFQISSGISRNDAASNA